MWMSIKLCLITFLYQKLLTLTVRLTERKIEKICKINECLQWTNYKWWIKCQVNYSIIIVIGFIGSMMQVRFLFQFTNWILWAKYINFNFLPALITKYFYSFISASDLSEDVQISEIQKNDRPECYSDSQYMWIWMRGW